MLPTVVMLLVALQPVCCFVGNLSDPCFMLCGVVSGFIFIQLFHSFRVHFLINDIIGGPRRGCPAHAPPPTFVLKRNRLGSPHPLREILDPPLDMYLNGIAVCDI